MPDYSRDKVYVSDIKKVALWYNTLHKLDLLVKEEPEADPKEEIAAETEPEAVPVVPKKKSAKKPKAE